MLIVALSKVTKSLLLAGLGLIAAPAMGGSTCARWDNPFGGATTLNGAVYAMTTWDPDGPGPIGEHLIVGGTFTQAGGVTVNRVARWDGDAWHALGGGVAGGSFPAVTALTTWDPDGDGPLHEHLIVAGGFITAGGVTVNRIARWDGAVWHSLDTGMNAEVLSLATWDPDGDGPMPKELVAGGNFVMAGATSAVRIARWDGTLWRRMSNGMNATVQAILTWDPDGPGPLNAMPVATGLFTTAGNSSAQRIAQWDGNGWQPLGGGVDAWAFALTVWDPDGDGPALPQVVVGGSFTTAGGVAAERIARWDGTSWEPLGSGMSGGVVPDVYALLEWDPDGDGPQPPALLAGGVFTIAGGQTVNCIARWDGAAWSALGAGVSAGPFVDVLSLALWDADADGPQHAQLVAGGEFLMAGEVEAGNIAIWSSLLPEFTQQPSNASAAVGANVSLTAGADNGPLILQWRKGGFVLTDGPTGSGSTISGATTTQLTITGVRSSDAGQYTLQATNACGSATSEPATLSVGSAPPCAGDTNGDNLVNGADLSVLLGQFGTTVTPGAGADFNADGVVNGADLSVLLGRFGLAC